MSALRIGLVVPSSNTTMETEIPELLRRQEQADGTAFTCHSSRVRMRQVNAAELARMNEASARCAAELADARCDVLAYACLVAVMAEGIGAHHATEQRLGDVAAGEGWRMPVVTSAGAILTGLAAVGAKRIVLIAPYVPDLTCKVVDYLQAHGIEVTDQLSLSVSDNLAVGRLDPNDLVTLADKLDLTGVHALVLSACVQMPSLPVVQQVEDKLGIPVVTAATATAHELLTRLGIEPRIRDAGRLLDGSRAS